MLFQVDRQPVKSDAFPTATGDAFPSPAGDTFPGADTFSPAGNAEFKVTTSPGQSSAFAQRSADMSSTGSSKMFGGSTEAAPGAVGTRQQTSPLDVSLDPSALSIIRSSALCLWVMIPSPLGSGTEHTAPSPKRTNAQLQAGTHSHPSHDHPLNTPFLSLLFPPCHLQDIHSLYVVSVPSRVDGPFLFVAGGQ